MYFEGTSHPQDRAGGEPLTAIDLFSGAGGFSLGAANAGFEVLAATDNWGPAVKTYEANFTHPIIDRDVRSISASDFEPHAGTDNRRLDLLMGGPPCQGFSIQRIGADVDTRNDLLFEFARLAIELAPRAFLMENVPGLLGSRGALHFEQFVEQMSEAGYTSAAVEVNAQSFGVPQNRRRVFVIGLDSPTAPLSMSRFQQPESAATTRTVWDAIGDLPAPPLDFTPSSDDPLHRRMRMSALNQKRLRLIPPGGGFEDLPVDLRVDCHKAGAEKIGHRSVYGRLDPHEPAGTITARFDSFTRGRFAHPYEHRNITLREGARLQTFPDDHKFEGTQAEVAALIGNAVPPLLATSMCSAVAGLIRTTVSDERSKVGTASVPL